MKFSELRSNIKDFLFLLFLQIERKEYHFIVQFNWWKIFVSEK